MTVRKNSPTYYKIFTVRQDIYSNTALYVQPIVQEASRKTSPEKSSLIRPEDNSLRYHVKFIKMSPNLTYKNIKRNNSKSIDYENK